MRNELIHKMKTVAKIRLDVDEDDNPIVEVDGTPVDLILASALTVKGIVEEQNLELDKLVALIHFYAQMFLQGKYSPEFWRNEND